MKLTIIFFLFFASIGNLFAAYVEKAPISLKQPDGKIITCFVTGDEYHKRVHDKDNYTIIRNLKSGYYVYAQLIGNELIATNYIVGKIKPQSLPLSPGYDVIDEKQENLHLLHLKSSQTYAEENITTKGVLNNIIISVRFADQGMTSFELTDYNKLYDSPLELSLNSYLDELSGSQLQANTVFFPKPNGQTLLEYQDDKNRDYYLQYDAINNPIGYKDSEYADRQKELINNAIKFVEAQILESDLDLDKNGDNVVDNLTFIIQGDVDAWGYLLWPMNYSFYTGLTNIGDLRVSGFIKLLSNQLSSTTICEEFTHSIGFPDFYRYSDNRISPVGNWILAQGNLTYSKWKYGKWFDNIPEITEPGIYSLKSTSSDPFSCFKIPSPYSSNEFFMLEYRKKEGIINSMLPDSYEEGMIIYRINSNISGNEDGPPDEVYIYRPNGSLSNNGDVFKAAFSENNSRTLFNDITNPSCFLSSESIGGITISDISLMGDEISFTVSEPSMLNPPRNPSYDLIESQIRLSWNSPDINDLIPNDLIGYNVYKLGEGNPLNPEVLTDSTIMLEINDYGQLLYKVTAVYDSGESLPAVVFVNYNPEEFADPKDSIALVTLYNSCNGENWLRNDNWLEGQVSFWYGVEVKNGRITELNLSNNNLKGILPSEIRFLTALERLILDFNSISGSLPDGIGNLTNVRELFIQNNELEGALPPSIGNLVSLQRLALSGNWKLSGKIPAELGQLNNLTLLALNANDFSGEIPNEIGNLTELRSLSLEQNQLTGSIPDGLERLKKLYSLSLSLNKLTGEIPDFIWELKSLGDLQLQYNQFTGTISSNIQNLESLRILGLSNNQLNGEVPAELWGLKNLSHLFLGPNNITCSKQDLELDLPNLEMIYFAGIVMNGSNILSELCKSKSIWSINLDSCQIGGVIPDEIENLSLLHDLYLGYNNLTGNIPKGLANLNDPIIHLLSNKFYFKEIEDFYNLIDFATFYYDYQQPELKVENHEVLLGDSVFINFDNYLLGENDRFDLFKWSDHLNRIDLLESYDSIPFAYMINSEDDLGLFQLHVHNDVLDASYKSDSFTISKLRTDATEIIEFNIEGQICKTIIDTIENNVIITLPLDLVLDNVFTEFVLSKGAFSSIQSNTYLDYSLPVNIVVTAIDGVTQQIWTVIIEKGEVINYVENITICAGDNYKGYTETGAFQKILTSIAGCDSIVITNLTVNPVYETTENITICEGETYNSWSTEGQYSESLTSISGCDSTVITDLSFYPSYQPGIIVQGNTLISTNNYLLYQWCDNIGGIIGATDSAYTISESGDYYLVITDENGCRNTSEIVDVTYTSIKSILRDNFKYSIFPNPNTGNFTFQVDTDIPDNLTLVLLRTTGQIIEIRKVRSIYQNHTELFDVSHLSKGIYFLIISSDKIQRNEKIVIQ